MTASILQQLLALYFALIYSWQLSSSETSSVGKKIIYIFKGFYRFRFTLHKYFFPFSLTNSFGYVKRMPYSEQPTILLARRHPNTMFLTDFENLIRFRTYFKSTRFLTFDKPTNYLYLFKNHRQTFLWIGKRPSPHLKLVICFKH